MWLARELKSQAPSCQIVYIGHKGDDFDSLKDSGHDFDFMAFIKAGKYRRYHGRNLLEQLLDIKTLGLNIRDFFRLPLSVLTALRLLRQFKPQVVFSKGGFVAVPVGLAARLLSIPVVTHDSDTVPGLANKIVGRFAVAHATGMPAKYYSYPAGSVIYTGIPVDPRIKKVTPKLQRQFKEQLGLSADSQVLMLSGGGNGSKRLNELLLSIARHLLNSNLALQLIHITGSVHEDMVRAGYKATLTKEELKRVQIAGFINDFYVCTGAADLVIGRAGATTLAELAAAGKACVIIPSPFLTGGHQLKNAAELAARNAAVIVEENVEPDELLVIVSELLNNDQRRFELARNLYATARPNAAAKLAQVILNTAKN